MIVRIDKGYVIAHNFQGKVKKLHNALEWTLWLATIRNCSASTINMYARTMERFWVWTLYNKEKEEKNESFSMYLARYREALLHGYQLTEKVYDEYLGTEVELTVANEKPKTKQTINKDLAGLKSYMYYIDESQLVENKSFIDIIYERKRSKKGPLGAIDIKKSNLYLETFGKRQSIIKPYKVPAKSSSTIKAFPHESFDALLEIANPREKLLYLLMGACSARIGQAINLTLYDIDYEKEDVWLLDPSSDYIDIYGHYRKQWLYKRYGIDVEQDKEHNDLSLKFKYPIPLKHEPLFWISDKYKKMFFANISIYLNSKDYIKENAREKPHPFFFITKSGRRLMPRGAYNTFKKYIRKLNNNNHSIPSNIGFHSLRHMFGVVMSEVFAKTGEDQILFLTKEAMGHSSIDSTMVYFNITAKTKRAKIKEAGEAIFNKNIDKDMR